MRFDKRKEVLTFISSAALLGLFYTANTQVQVVKADTATNTPAVNKNTKNNADINQKMSKLLLMFKTMQIQIKELLKEALNTRIIEHKHFEFGKGDKDKTIITREYPADWHRGDEPYYPVNNKRNNDLYAKYAELAKKQGKVIFGGRLGQYKYYNMDQVIEAALNVINKEL